METEHVDLIVALSEILGMEPAMLRRAVEAARARNDEAGLSALMMRAADAKMAAGLTDNIRRTVRGEQAGAFSIAICMEWNALYEQALTAAETALAEERAINVALTVERDDERAKREEAERVWAPGGELAWAVRPAHMANSTDGVRCEAHHVPSNTRALGATRSEALYECQRARADRAEAELRRVYLAVRNQDVSTQPADVRDLSRVIIDEVDELRRWVDESEQKAANAIAAANESEARLCEAEKKIDRAEAALAEARSQASAMHRRAQAAEGEAERVRNAYSLPACCADAARARDKAETDLTAARAALATARSEALREAAGVPAQVIADLRRRGLLTAGDGSVARSIESSILALIGASESGEGS